ncbi:MAG: phosphoadenosine phosphosulfate reductase [Planctomycetes bacterium]|nr:phosphoadenosine phosphosulfate reductase [Planctomycetota bacterium]
MAGKKPGKEPYVISGIPEGKKIVSWGGGVNSTALLIGLYQRRIRPDLILFADPGHEWPETYLYRDHVMIPWLASVGFPELVTVRRREMPGVKMKETLGQSCLRLKVLPAMAFGQKQCSMKFKRDPQNDFMKRLPWAKTEWAAGRKIVKIIGYDAAEKHRLRGTAGNAWEDKRFRLWYPLVDWGMDRAACIRLIADAGLPVPKKSACTFCPANTLDEWEHLRNQYPHLYRFALSIEAEARITNPDIIGLMRRGKVGERSLVNWNKRKKGGLWPHD